MAESKQQLGMEVYDLKELKEDIIEYQEVLLEPIYSSILNTN